MWPMWSNLLKKSLTVNFIFCAAIVVDLSIKNSPSCSAPEVFRRKGVLKNFSKFAGKHLFQSLFLIKFHAEACNFIKKETLAQVFSCDFCKIFKNIFYYKITPVVALFRKPPGTFFSICAYLNSGQLLFLFLPRRISLNEIKKCPYSELFWSAFSRVRTEYGEILRISSYSVRIREKTDQKNSEYVHFSRSELHPYSLGLYKIYLLEIINLMKRRTGFILIGVIKYHFYFKWWWKNFIYKRHRCISSSHANIWDGELCSNSFNNF